MKGPEPRMLERFDGDGGNRTHGRFPPTVAEDSRRALERLMAWARGDHICSRCKGEGELYPSADDFLECPDCEGTGEVA